MVCSFFLGANTPKGFYSLFSQLDGFDLSVVKGGSGSGKSTLIKSIIEKNDTSGLCERILCSSDTDSLDGAVFHNLNSAIVDGTAPHYAEVKGLGKYIATPPADAEIEAHRSALSALKNAKSKAYEEAYLSLAGYSNALKRAISIIPFDAERFTQRAAGIVAREALTKRDDGKIHYRFIDCINHSGFSTLWNTVSNLASKIYVIESRFSLASAFFKKLESDFKKRGYTVFSCLSPLSPEETRHIIIPELSLAFVTSDELSEYKGAHFRKIHIASYIDKTKYKAMRQKIRLCQKLSENFLNDAIDSLASARLSHIEIENIYRPHLNIPALNRLIQAESI